MGMDDVTKISEMKTDMVLKVGAARILEKPLESIDVKYKPDETPEYMRFEVFVGGKLDRVLSIHNGSQKYPSNICVGLFLRKLCWQSLFPKSL